MAPFEQLSQINGADIDRLTSLYDEEWWTKGRARDDVAAMLEHCDLIIAYRDPATQTLVAFARILTDFVYKAFIFDVIVDRNYRSQGLGSVLMNAITRHPQLAVVAAMELYCLPEMVPFYQKWAFVPVTSEKPFCLMRRTKQN